MIDPDEIKVRPGDKVRCIKEVSGDFAILTEGKEYTVITVIERRDKLYYRIMSDRGVVCNKSDWKFEIVEKEYFNKDLFTI